MHSLWWINSKVDGDQKREAVWLFVYLLPAASAISIWGNNYY